MKNYKSLNEILSEFPVTMEIPILWGYMDAFQHVNNVMFFRFFESVRVEYFDKTGFRKWKKEKGIGPILSSTQCSYKAPLHYPDTVTVGAKTTNLEDDRYIMKLILFSHKLNRVAAEGKAVVVSFDYVNNKKISIPEEVKNNTLLLERNLHQ